MKGLMKSAIRDSDLVAFIEEISYYGKRGEVPEGEYFTPFEAKVRRPGKDITIITWGPKMLDLAIASAEELAKQNPPTDTEIVDLRILNPWDKKTVFASVKKTGRVIILHEDSKFMGFGAEISATIVEEFNTYYRLRTRVRRIAAENTPIPAHLALEDARLPNKDKVISAVRELLKEG